MKTIDLRDVDFGYADAERELSQSPELFDKAFIDPNSYLSDLLYGIKFLVLGRKGSGKTAYGAKIRRMATDKANMITARTCPLSRLDYTLFEKFADDNVLGGRRFSSTWEYLLLVEFMKMIDEDIGVYEEEKVEYLIAALKKHGILCDEDLVHSTKVLEKKGIRLSIAGALNGEYDNEKEIELNDADDISELLLKTIKRLHFGDHRFFLIIDSLDDSIRGKAFSSDIITGLLRAAEFLNQSMANHALNFKVLILMRSDIFALCRDPDLTKISRDLSINLSWNEAALKEIALKRIQQTHTEVGAFDDFWRNMYPSEFRYKDSMKHMFENTLLRPRDILQFFIESQKVFNARRYSGSFTHHELASILAQYSEDYFATEMQDEITGFVSDNAVTALPTALSRLNKCVFSVDEFRSIIELMSEFVGCRAEKILELLFMGGYIGQFRKRKGMEDRSFVAFRFRNSLEKFDVNDNCFIHKGLRKALNL